MSCRFGTLLSVAGLMLTRIKKFLNFVIFLQFAAIFLVKIGDKKFKRNQKSWVLIPDYFEQPCLLHSFNAT